MPPKPSHGGGIAEHSAVYITARFANVSANYNKEFRKPRQQLLCGEKLSSLRSRAERRGGGEGGGELIFRHNLLLGLTASVNERRRRKRGKGDGKEKEVLSKRKRRYVVHGTEKEEEERKKAISGGRRRSFKPACS